MSANLPADSGGSRIDKIVVLSVDLAHAVDFYWLALSKFQNVLEDIEGADQRLGYLKSLRYLLIECVQEMDAILTGGRRRVASLHALSYALQSGIEFLGMSGAELSAALGLNAELEFIDLQNCLLGFGRWVRDKLPGTIPAAQGDQGQREVLRAMRGWAAAAKQMEEDLGFLAARLREL